MQYVLGRGAMAKKASKKRSRRTAFVPTVVFGTAVMGVIPACAMGCGGQSSTSSTSSNDAAADHQVFTVAAVGYCAFCDSGYLTVAAIGFDAGKDAATDSSTDSGSDASLPCGPELCAVAVIGFDAGLDSGDKG